MPFELVAMVWRRGSESGWHRRRFVAALVLKKNETCAATAPDKARNHARVSRSAVWDLSRKKRRTRSFQILIRS